ncbi:GLPGLI family protein [Flavobacterium restrictum]|uniref:GLPGLI family protein n=1 Tax=Flavobacterium restrictum TaxID=2594428 RepID=A0A553E2D2_9FLAO|nr:GLPGLI family protein [Flavobacterium restrictum]TRX39196.1 GLPGLI family protein [Flavobacterium restrictum]
MKKKIFILLIATIISYGQNIKAVYVSTSIKSMGEDDGKSSEIKPRTFTYSYSNKKSIYTMVSIQKSSIDTSFIEHDGIKFPTYNEVIVPSSDITYKDLKNNLLLKEYTIQNKNFSAKDKLTDYQWIITDEKAVINGYNCTKATTTKDIFPVSAWFCDEIPINDGPVEFWGLPGLILKVDLGGYSVITLDRIKITKENLPVNEPENKSKQESLDNFYNSIDSHLSSTSIFSTLK